MFPCVGLKIFTPLPGSLVVSDANEGVCPSQQSFTAKSKNAKKLNLFGWKMYLTACLHLRVANPKEVLEHYDFSIWDNILKFMDKLLEKARQVFLAVADEGKMVAQTCLQAALGAADSTAKAVASAIRMHR